MNTNLLENVSFPPTPWHMKGFSMQCLSLVDAKVAREFVPDRVKIIEVLPNKTIGGIYLAHYNSTSSLSYWELAIFCSLAYYKGNARLWMSHVYVDSLSSVKSGLDMWGWPKEYANFAISTTGDSTLVEATQNNSPLIQLGFKSSPFYIKAPMFLPFFGIINNQILSFNGKGTMKLGINSSNIKIPDASPFSMLKINKPFLNIHSQKIDMTFGSIKQLEY